MKYFAFLLLVSFLSFGYSADSTVIDNKVNKIPVYKSSVGFAAGFITGYGLSYRKRISDKNIIQITGVPYFFEKKYSFQDSLNNNRYNGYYNIGNLSLGVTLDHVIARAMELSISNYFGCNFNIDYEKSDYWSLRWGDDEHIVKDKFSNKFTLGGGLGGELQLWRLIANFKLGIRGFYNFTDQTKGIYPSIEVAGYFGY